MSDENTGLAKEIIDAVKCELQGNWGAWLAATGEQSAEQLEARLAAVVSEKLAENSCDSLEGDAETAMNVAMKEMFSSHPFEQFAKLGEDVGAISLIHSSVRVDPRAPSNLTHADGRRHVLTWSYGQGRDHHACSRDVIPASDDDPIPFTTALHDLMIAFDKNLVIRKPAVKECIHVAPVEE